ncbi:MAG: GH3 auxin-responsive promoter family protein, partial [Chloroflexaceae bacterium]|nr:GH3 auxin-responsive promoter family protein [Chloroflexaceae bacterium]
MLPTAANTLWYLACLPEARAFQRATRHVAATQRELLLDMVRRNAASAFGWSHGFARMRSVADFQAAVPLRDYDDYAPWIERIGAGEPGVLTAEPVTLLEPTGGSSGGRKLIPYTASLHTQFQRGIAPWIADLFAQKLALRAGAAYWSVSPVAHVGEQTAGGIPVGFNDDGEYLGSLTRRLSRAVLAVPGAVRLISDMAAFRYVTLLFLLRRADLALVSVWNPTFLSLLLSQLDAWWPRLASDIAEGTLTPPAPLA